MRVLAGEEAGARDAAQRVDDEGVGVRRPGALHLAAIERIVCTRSIEKSSIRTMHDVGPLRALGRRQVGALHGRPPAAGDGEVAAPVVTARRCRWRCRTAVSAAMAVAAQAHGRGHAASYEQHGLPRPW